MSSRSPFLTAVLAVLALFLFIQLKRDARLREETREALREARALRPDARPAPVSAPTAAPVSPAAAPLSASAPGGAAPVSEGTAVYRRVSPAVVAVANNALVRRGFFGFQLVEVPRGAGTGFVWDKQGHIVSNYHVVHQAGTLTVSFPDGTQYPAELVGIAPDYDLAVLKIDAPAGKLTPVEAGDSRRLAVGQPVYAIGNPFGLDTTLSAGIVSAMGRTITSMTDRKIRDVIQTDAAINPGNSGGPLLDAAGRLVGVNTAILSPSGAYAGIGFAVPSATVSRVVPQLIKNGRVTRAGLGVELLPDHVAERAGIEGVAVYAVRGGTPAARAGIEGLAVDRLGAVLFGDVIAAVDGRPVRTIEELQAALDPHAPGDRVRLTLRRRGIPRDVTLALSALE